MNKRSAAPRGERIDLWPAYPDRQEALKAVGLEEWSVSVNLDLVRSD